MNDNLPPSTVAELRDVLIQFEANRPRSMQKELGPSELGTPCQQQIARKLAGAPQRPITAPTWAPWQGTCVHAGMEEVLRFWNAQLGRERWIIEERLTAAGALPGVADHPGYPAVEGNGDAYDTDHDEVVDWKYVGTTALEKLRTAKRLGKPPREQVSQEYRVQGHIYGAGHAAKGRPVKSVKLVLLARSWQFDDSEEWSEPYDQRIADWAIERYYGVVDLVHALDVAHQPDAVAAVPASPSSEACKWCVFHRGGQPSDWHGCAGDVDATQRAVDRLTDGLIAPRTPAHAGP
jgi:hypothetical protein